MMMTMRMMQAQWHHQEPHQQQYHKQDHHQYHLLVAASLWLILIPSCGHFAVHAQLSPAQQACVVPLENLLVCLPYSQGKTPLPTPECCNNVANIFHTQKKCLCELIAASFTNTPGLPTFNQTLALALPSVCNVPADPSKCPGLLGIAPSSPEAKIFDDAPGSSLRSPSSPGMPSSAGLTANSSSSSFSSNSLEAMKTDLLMLPISLTLLFRLIM